MAEATRKLRDAIPRAVTFVQEAWAEMKKVHYPTRKETYAATSVVVVIVAIVALYLGLVDFVLSQAVQLLVR